MAVAVITFAVALALIASERVAGVTVAGRGGAAGRGLACAKEEIRGYLTRDEVLVEDDFSDTLLAETFLHHRVLVVPIATGGHVHAVITRNDFFRALSRRLEEMAEEAG